MMKNKFPCEIIRDLLPGYIDGLSSDVTNLTVEEHLAECSECKKIKDNMMNEENKEKLIEKVHNNGDKQLFKKIKNKLNKKVKAVISIAAIAVIVIAFSLYVMFTVPLKNVDLSDIQVSAKVYPVSELEKEKISQDENDLTITFSDENIKISSDTEDNSEMYYVNIPDIDNDKIMITNNTLENNKYITTISWSCSYFLREISYDYKQNEKSNDTLYISAFKTTVLGNKAQEYQSKMIQMEFKQINKIVFVNHSGQETVLWENK